MRTWAVGIAGLVFVAACSSQPQSVDAVAPTSTDAALQPTSATTTTTTTKPVVVTTVVPVRPARPDGEVEDIIWTDGIDIGSSTGLIIAKDFGSRETEESSAVHVIDLANFDGTLIAALCCEPVVSSSLGIVYLAPTLADSAAPILDGNHVSDIAAAFGSDEILVLVRVPDQFDRPPIGDPDFDPFNGVVRLTRSEGGWSHSIVVELTHEGCRLDVAASGAFVVLDFDMQREPWEECAGSRVSTFTAAGEPWGEDLQLGSEVAAHVAIAGNRVLLSGPGISTRVWQIGDISTIQQADTPRGLATW